MNSIITNYYCTKTKYLLLIIILLSIANQWVFNSLLINEDVFYNTFSNQLAYDRIIGLFNKTMKIAWISYLLQPVMCFIKFLLVSIVLYIGLFFLDLNGEIKFETVFKVVVASELIFILAGIIKIFWFAFISYSYDLNDLAFFYPLSLSNFFKSGEVNKMWIYPLQVLNIFHLIYIIGLVQGLQALCGKNQIIEKVVLITYLPGLILWIVLLIFLSFN